MGAVAKTDIFQSCPCYLLALWPQSPGVSLCNRVAVSSHSPHRAPKRVWNVPGLPRRTLPPLCCVLLLEQNEQRGPFWSSHWARLPFRQLSGFT